jgi:hypothetical protein
VLGVQHPNESPKDHINRRRKQCWRQEQEKSLHDEWDIGIIGAFIGVVGTGCVAYYFDCGGDDELHARLQARDNLHRSPIKKAIKYHVFPLTS